MKINRFAIISELEKFEEKKNRISQIVKDVNFDRTTLIVPKRITFPVLKIIVGTLVTVDFSSSLYGENIFWSKSLSWYKTTEDLKNTTR